MQRQKFSREFKIEAVKLVWERGCRSRRRRAIWTCMKTCCASGFANMRPIRDQRLPDTV